MKFIIMVEEGGYQVRYWDQISDEIGESIATNWDKNVLHKTLSSKGFNISKKILYKAVKELDETNEPFIVLKSQFRGSVDLDTFMNDMFTIDEDLNG